MRPRVPDQLYSNGSGKWGFVIGSGAVRAAGYVIAVVLVARSEAEVQHYISATHELMQVGKR